MKHNFEELSEAALAFDDLVEDALDSLHRFCEQQNGDCQNCKFLFRVEPDRIMPCPYKTLCERIEWIKSGEITK